MEATPTPWCLLRCRRGLGGTDDRVWYLGPAPTSMDEIGRARSYRISERCLLTLPLLEGVSVVENENLIQHWRVLANHGADREDTAVLPRKGHPGSDFRG